jgi:hypothetical protein
VGVCSIVVARSSSAPSCRDEAPFTRAVNIVPSPWGRVGPHRLTAAKAPIVPPQPRLQLRDARVPLDQLVERPRKIAVGVRVAGQVARNLNR